MLDHAVMSELRRSLGPDGADAFRRVVDTYLAHEPVLLGALRAALALGQWEELGRAAHTLRSSSASLGALQLSDAARRVEAAAQARDLEAREGLVLLEELAEAVRVALRSEVARASG